MSAEFKQPQSITRIRKRSRPLHTLCSAFKLFCIGTLFLVSLEAGAIEPPFVLPQPSELERIKSAVIITSKGSLTFELFPHDAPWHVANFKYLADKGFYRGKDFHIFIQDFILQGGRAADMRLRYALPPEFNAHKHEFGTLGMARAPDYLNPTRASSSSQFHILLRDASNMDGAYTIFGKLLKGSEVLESLRQFDKIQEVVVYVEDDSADAHAHGEKVAQSTSWVLMNN